MDELDRHSSSLISTLQSTQKIHYVQNMGTRDFIEYSILSSFCYHCIYKEDECRKPIKSTIWGRKNTTVTNITSVT